MENGREKQLIFVKDLVFRALYQWKVILVAALVFAVLLGGFSMLKDGQDVQVGGLNMTPQTQAKVEELEFRLERYDQMIEKQKTYIQNSPYMALDPYAFYVCGFLLCPTPDYGENITEATPVEQDTNVLLRTYRTMVTDATVFEEFSRVYGGEAQYLRELVILDTTTEGTLGIRVYGSDWETPRKLAEALAQVAEECEATIDRDVQNHSLKVIPFQNGPLYDNTLLEAQNTAYQKLSTYESERLTINNELTRYKPTQLVAESGNPLLYAIIGAFLGAFLVVCVIWVIHLGSDKIYSARVLTNRTGVRVLGCTDSGKKRFFFDRWLRKLEGRSGSEEAALAMNIRNRCRDCKTLLIMGSFSGDVLSGVVSELEQSGVSCRVCKTKAEALETLPNCDSVVLAETCGVSCYSQVEWAMETVSDYQKDLVGCVLIDG